VIDVAVMYNDVRYNKRIVVCDKWDRDDEGGGGCCCARELVNFVV
jgi:hypothetical protein